jgi:hypothetical protein
MGDISDAALMAYVDGELDVTEAQQVAEYVARTPEAQARLQAFAMTGHGLGELFNAPMTGPVPQRLIDVLQIGQVATPARQRAARVAAPTGAGFLASLRDFFVPQFGVVGFASAVIVSAGLGWGLKSLTSAQQSASSMLEVASSGVIAAGALRDVLDGAISSSEWPTDGDNGKTLARAALTLRTANGGFCRKLEVKGGAGADFAGVACRVPDGQWRLEVFTPIVVARDTSGRVSTSGKEGERAVESMLDRLTQGDALSVDEEKKLIAKKWRVAQ